MIDGTGLLWQGFLRVRHGGGCVWGVEGVEGWRGGGVELITDTDNAAQGNPCVQVQRVSPVSTLRAATRIWIPTMTMTTSTSLSLSCPQSKVCLLLLSWPNS